MFSINKLKKKNFAVYGLGATGKSIISYFKKRGFSNYCTYDDYKKSNKKNIFIKYLKTADFIILSPGINIIKSKLKKNLLENKQKIISDLDLFYMTNSKIKTIVVTGTNGKSTTCKMLEHLLKKNKINSHLGGNIGTPILKLKSNKNTVIVIEASSYQLSYSKFVKPSCALILNISNDHLEWHGNMKNYVNSKFKIFLLQNRQNISILKQKKLIKIFKKKKFKSRLKIVSPLIYKNINKKINNDYLNLDNNLENMSFVYEVSKIFKINKKNFINSMTSFKGLPHRYENFLNKKNIKFINDSKATSFKASVSALNQNQNIFWIVGGQPKFKDKFIIKNIKNNIIKCFIIGKHISFFKSQIKNKIKKHVAKSLENALLNIFKEIKKYPDKQLTVLFSPASASFDQYQNFIQRGNEFKKISKLYAKKYL